MVMEVSILVLKEGRLLVTVFHAIHTRIERPSSCLNGETELTLASYAECVDEIGNFLVNFRFFRGSRCFKDQVVLAVEGAINILGILESRIVDYSGEILFKPRNFQLGTKRFWIEVE